MILAFVLFGVLEAQAQGAKDGDYLKLVRDLRSSNPAVRGDAADALRKAGVRALKALRSAAEDPDPEVRARAGSLIRFIRVDQEITPGLKKCVPGVAERLAHGEPHIWTELFLSLVERGDLDYPWSSSLPAKDLSPLALRALRGARTPEERIDVSIAVSHLRLSGAEPELTRMLEDDGRSIPTTAAWALGRVGARGAVPAIRKLLRRDYRKLGNLVIFHAVVQLDAEEAFEELLPYLRMDVDPFEAGEVYEAAVHTMGHVAGKGRAEELLPLVGDKNPQVRAGAIYVLGRIGERRAVPLLTPLLGDHHYQVRANAVEAFGLLGSAESIPAIAARLGDDWEVVQLALPRALIRLGAAKSAQVVETLLAEKKDPEFRNGALEMLGLLRMKSAVPVLRAVPESSEDGFIASQALAELGNEEGLDRMIRIMKRDKEAPHGSWGWNLGRVRGKKYAADILPLLKHRRDGVRRSAAVALGKLGGREAIEKLRPLLRERDIWIQAAAAASLIRLGSEDGAVPLLEVADGTRMMIASSMTATSVPIASLNALRRPKEWDRLSRSPLSRSYIGTTREVIAGLAGEAKLSLSLGEDFDWYDTDWLRGYSEIHLGGTSLSILDGLEEQFSWSPWTFILEKDTLRVVTRRQALPFWKKWWKEREERKREGE